MSVKTPQREQGKAAIVAVGSPFAPDQLAWQAAELIRRQVWFGCGAWQDWVILTLDRPGVALLEPLRQFHRVILLDALDASGDGPIILSLEALASSAQRHSSHGFGVADSLQLGRALGCLPAQLAIVGLPINREPEVETLSACLHHVLASFSPRDTNTGASSRAS